MAKEIKKTESKTVKELQVEAAELDVQKSKLLEQVNEINLRQQQIMTQVYETALIAYKSQAFPGTGGLLVPGNNIQMGM